MLTVTEPAKQTLSKMLDDANAPEGKAARFVPQGNQLQLTLDEANDDDTTYEHDGKAILLVSPQLGQMLNEYQLDLIETPQGAGLGFKPQAEAG